MEMMKYIKQKKGIFFTLDALILLSIIISAVFLMSTSHDNTLLSLPNSYVSEDVMRILAEMKMSEVNQTWIAEKIANGDIVDINQSVLTQLGDFWSKDNFTLAEELVSITVGSIANTHDFGVWINNEQIFTTTANVQGKLLSNWRVVSGIEKDKPTRGFLSTARARTISKNQTLFIPISPEGAGWDEGIYTVTSFFNLSNYTLIESTFAASIHSGTKINDLKITLNGDQSCVYKRNDIDWIFIDSEGNVGNVTIDTSCFVNDINKLEIEFRNDGDNAHTHPGMHLLVKYELQEFVKKQPTQRSKRYYFDNIVSRSIGNDGSGVWSAFPFDIPFGATDISVKAQIVGDNIRDYVTGEKCRVLYGGANLNDPCPSFPAWDATNKPPEDYDYVIFLNSDTPLDSDANPISKPTYIYNQTNLSSYLKTGTNVFAVYFNNYLDRVWGTGSVTLYSDAINDPDGSSYVEVNYTLPALDDIPFGAIQINAFTELGGENLYSKEGTFTYPEFLDAGGDVHLHILQRDSQRITVDANSYYPAVTEQFNSPSDRAVPSSIYISASQFDTSPLATNYLSVTDISITNLILNISTIEYGFYIPSYIGFGEVFETELNATTDAKTRLLARMYPYVTSDDIVSQSQSVSNVPSIWGPVVVEVRSWD